MAQEPTNTPWLRDLFIARNWLGRLTEREGDMARAIAHFESSEAIMLALVQAYPDRPSFARELEIVQRALARLRGNS